MILTLADARSVCARFVEAGSCNNTVVDARINEALERLMDLQPWQCLRRMAKISVCNGCFPLAYNVEKIVWAAIGGIPSKIFGQPYQFLSSGPGDLDYRASGSGFLDLLDMGDHWCTMYDVPRFYEDSTGTKVAYTGLRLAAFSTEAADTTLKMTVEGFNDTAEEIFDDSGNRGEELTIQRWDDGVEGVLRGKWGTSLALTTNYFADVRLVRKAETAGYVTLYAVDDTNHYYHVLAKYHPKQTLPQFRRYRITNKTIGERADVLALVQLRHVPLVASTDILPVTSLQSVKLMVMALREENAGNLQGAVAYMAQAQAVLGKREEANTMSDGVPVIMNTDYRLSLGRALNKGGIL